MKLRFTAEDFYSAFPGREYENANQLCYDAAIRANARLAAMLVEAPVVYATQLRSAREVGEPARVWERGSGPEPLTTHRARLVEVEELPR